MDQSSSRLGYLFNGYMKNNSTEPERQEFMDMIKQEENLPELSRLLENEMRKGPRDHKIADIRADELYKNIIHMTDKYKPAKIVSFNKTFRWWRPVAAAVLIMIVAAGILFLFNRIPRKNLAITQQEQKTIPPPGKEGAVLTLSNG